MGADVRKSCWSGRHAKDGFQQHCTGAKQRTLVVNCWKRRSCSAFKLAQSNRVKV